MVQPENAFAANARVAPPASKQVPAKPVYIRAGQDYPSWRFHETGGSRLVKDAADDQAALEAGYRSTPFPVALPEPPVPNGRDNSAAWKMLADRLTAENEKLTEENMRLKSQVEDSQNLPLIADLKEKLAISERARTGLQTAADASERQKALMRAEKQKAAEFRDAEAVPAEPEPEDDLMQLIRQHGSAEPPPEE